MLQLALWRAYQQDPQAVHRWKEEDYPRLRRPRATPASPDTLRRRGGGAFGFPQRHHLGAARSHAGCIQHRRPLPRPRMLSAVSAQGQLRFMLVAGTGDGSGLP